ncbi:hypothetical protein SteCoe_14199 [Stentor coeruleus]|uniref:Uncharacterized protein n=1 Tax=Stentor coeruleus TaxID=5963 RepID=A0A1R2C6G5_9CILI|nr:hypothetical protein SteCoe_14199 [Stentor coeruleus]
MEKKESIFIKTPSQNNSSTRTGSPMNLLATHSKSVKSENSQVFGIPKHADVIAFVSKNRKQNLSWVSELTIPPKALPYSKRKTSLQERINRRKAKIDYDIPKDAKKLTKLLNNIKETERIIRQDIGFFEKIRSKKLRIELKLTESEPPTRKAYEKHSMLVAPPSKLPRSGIIFKDQSIF